MKLLFLSFLFLLIFTKSFCQSYIPIPDSNITWLHTWHHWDWSSPDGEQIVYTSGDTTINSINYVKVNEKLIWPVESNVSNSLGYLAAFRNDTVNMKVFVVPKDSIDEILLYDFNVNVGDTVKNTFCMEYWGGNMASSPTLDFYVEAVDSFLLGANYHQIIIVSNGTMGGPPVKWFEGFGSNYGLFGDKGYGNVSFWQEWNCVTLDSLSYSNVFDSVIISSFACPSALSTQNLEITEFELFPNPTTSSFQISSSNNQTYSLSIYSSIGKLILNKDEVFSVTSVSSQAWDKGVYLIQLKLEDGTVLHNKIIKD